MTEVVSSFVVGHWAVARKMVNSCMCLDVQPN